MKNLLFLLGRYPGYGGIECVTTHLANYLCQYDKFRVFIFSFSSQCENDLLPLLNKKVGYFCSGDNDFLSKKNEKLLTDFLTFQKIDLVINQDSYANTYKTFIKAQKRIDQKIDFIEVEHNVPDYINKSFSAFGKKGFINFLRKIKGCYLNSLRHRELYSICKKYVLLSSGFIDAYKSVTHQLNVSKLVSIPNPVTVLRPSEIPAEKENVCLFCGRLNSQKGLFFLLDIWAKVYRKFPNWKLQIVGDGELKNSLIDYIEKNEILLVEFCGFHVDMTPFYQKAKIFCMTSIFEGWGLTITEAMTYGCVPLQFGSYAAVTDVIDDNRNGFIVKPFDVEDYVHKLELLMSNNSLCESFAENSFEKAKLFDINTIGEKWLNIIS